jgi:hypothetical protein
MNNSSSADGSQQANMLDNENADIKYGMDGAETSMVTLVDGKLVSIGDTSDDVEDQLMNRYSSDEERGLQGLPEKIYETSDAALREEGPANMRQLTDNMAEADLTQDPFTADPNETGAPDSTNAANDHTQTVGWATDLSTMMVPASPGTAEPMPTSPDIPDPYTPAPMPPSPVYVPEIPNLPNEPMPANPEVQEPSQPDRSHEINARITLTASATLTTGPGEGMTTTPNTGSSERPYNVDANERDEYTPVELTDEAAQMDNQPREAMDESLSKKEQMDGGNYPVDPAGEKSTDGLDIPTAY